MEWNSNYVNSGPGKYKITCLTLGAIGLVSVWLCKSGSPQYQSLAGFAWLVTLILLLILILLGNLFNSSIWGVIELIICLILTICYIVATIDIFKTCWSLAFDRGSIPILPFIGSLIATICSIFATLTYAADTASRGRSTTSSSTSNV